MPAAVETRTVTPALASSLRVAIARLNRRLRTERLQGAEVSLGQVGVLARLHCDGDLTIGALADSEGVKPPSMTRTVAAMEGSGLVRRRPHATDGRQVLVALTPEGKATLTADRRRRDVWLMRALADFTPEERSVLATAAPLLERLAESGR